ncbi:MAG: hypothetical protein M3310_08225, partial [Actinomycetota bacterium]|nr:hypothetical protein [Actinomycetota bacterium]
RWMRALRWAAVAVGALAVFAAGVAVGQALEERPKAGQPVTTFATIRPWTLTDRTTTAQADE